MAQNYTGSNNINLLMPAGQFGTRVEMGKDAASARYTFTYLCKIVFAIFPKENELLLKYLTDDGQLVEPVFYMPIIPMILVNGASGIATAWSSKIPMYNPKQIVNNIKLRLDGKPFEPIHPWYNGFLGTIESAGPGRYTVNGRLEKISKYVYRVGELPIGIGTTNYKEKTLYPLAGIEATSDAAKKRKTKKAATAKRKASIKAKAAALKKKNNSKKKKAATTKKKKKNDDDNDDKAKKGKKEKKIFDILEILENNTDEEVSFTITLTRQGLAKAEKVGFYKYFKLISSIATTNMVLFNAKGQIKKYKDVEEIQEEFFKHCLQFYKERKEKVLENLKKCCNIRQNKVKYIKEMRANTIDIKGNDKVVLKEFVNHKYTPYPKPKKAKVAGMDIDNNNFPNDRDDANDILILSNKDTNEEDEKEEEEEEEEDESDKNKKISKLSDFEYLLNMTTHSLTLRIITKLEQELKETQEEIIRIENTSPEDMWRSDLDTFLKAYKQHKQDIIDNIKVAQDRIEKENSLKRKRDGNDAEKKKANKKNEMKKYVKPETGTYIKPPAPEAKIEKKEKKQDTTSSDDEDSNSMEDDKKKNDKKIKIEEVTDDSDSDDDSSDDDSSDDEDSE